jgi:ABC-type transport system substrate-binding protein
MITEPGTFDPAMVTETPTSELLQNIYEGLVRIDDHNRVAPCLAEKWTIDAKGTQYMFTLREGARFHNGRPVTSQDVIYSLERALKPETKSPIAKNYLAGLVGAAELAEGRADRLAGLKAIDDRTLQITLDKPRGYFLGALAYSTGWVVCKEAIESNGRRLDEKSAIGTGPFKLAAYVPHSKVTLDAFPEYRPQPPSLKRILRPIVLDSNTRHAMYENGELDLVGLAISDYLRDRDDPVLKHQLMVTPAATTIYIVMQQDIQPIFRGVRVRQAFIQALDRDEIVRICSNGVWTRADGFLPPGMPGYDEKLRRQPFDPKGSRELLKLAGYTEQKPFPTLKLEFVKTAPVASALAQLVRDQLRQNLGVSIDLQERELGTFRNECSTGKVAFGVTDWGADYIDPQNFLSTILHSKAKIFQTGFRNARFDELCDKADGLSDMAARIQLYSQADQIVTDEVAVLPLIYGTGRTLVKPYIKDLKLNLMSLTPHYSTRIAPEAGS